MLVQGLKHPGVIPRQYRGSTENNDVYRRQILLSKTFTDHPLNAVTVNGAFGGLFTDRQTQTRSAKPIGPEQNRQRLILATLGLLKYTAVIGWREQTLLTQKPEAQEN